MAEPVMPAVTYMDVPAEGTMVADGTEQEIYETAGSPPFTLSAWLDLSNMEVGDGVTVRQYVKLNETGEWVKYAEESYSDFQGLPGLFITTKPAVHGARITFMQTAGSLKVFDYIVIRQRSVIDRGSIVFTS